MIVFPAKVAAARAAAGLSRRAGAGGGTSLPGKLLLRMAPDAIPRLSRRIAGGAVVVSATNGKTTTLEDAGGDARARAAAVPELRRREPRLGRRLVAARVPRAPIWASSRSTRRALEVVAPALAPRVLGLGNLFRDQLDRYGELEAVAARWRRISADGPWRLVRNADDPLVAGLPARAGSLSYGIDDPSVPCRPSPTPPTRSGAASAASA